MIKILVQAILLFLASAAFLGMSGILGQYGLEKWSEFRSYRNYNYVFFDGDPITKSTSNPDEVRQYLNDLDQGKRNADNQLERDFGNRKTLARFRKINDYTFRVFRDTWFIQNEWFKKNGRFFQGKKTMPEIPNSKRNLEVDMGFGLTDQVSDWKDVGYEERYSPVQLECHVYAGPEGHGFTIWARFEHMGTIHQNQMHIGPQDYRNKNNFTWISND